MQHVEGIFTRDTSQISDGNFFESVAEAFHRDDPTAAQKQLESDRVRCIQLLYHAIARGAFGEALELTTEDFTLEIFAPDDHPMRGRWQGREAVLEAMQRNFALVAEQRPKVQSLVAQGDVVVIIAHEEGIIRASGAPYEVRWVQEFSFANGKVKQVREFIDGGANMAFDPE